MTQTLNAQEQALKALLVSAINSTSANNQTIVNTLAYLINVYKKI